MMKNPVAPRPQPIVALSRAGDLPIAAGTRRIAAVIKSAACSTSDANPFWFYCPAVCVASSIDTPNVDVNARKLSASSAAVCSPSKPR